MAGSAAAGQYSSTVPPPSAQTRRLPSPNLGPPELSSRAPAASKASSKAPPKAQARSSRWVWTRVRRPGLRLGYLL